MKGTRIVRVDPDGTVTRCEGSDLIAVATAGVADLGGYHGPAPWGEQIDRDVAAVDVASMYPHGLAPFPHERRVMVMAVHEWGIPLKLPLNVKAWSLYGRSPVAGPAFLSFDAGSWVLPEAWIKALSQPPDWVSVAVLARMKLMAEQAGVEWFDG